MTDCDEIIATLRAHRAELEALGVRHAALFGSYARGDAGLGSDIDVAVEFVPSRYREGLGYFGARQRLEDRLRAIFAGTVDVSDYHMMRSYVREGFEADHVNAF